MARLIDYFYDPFGHLFLELNYSKRIRVISLRFLGSLEYLTRLSDRLST